MALNTHISDAVANMQADALAALLDGGYLRLYDGAQPADANTPVSSQNKLAELRLGSPAFSAAVGGAISAQPITSDSDAAATGNATWFRCFESDGSTAVLDGSVGTSGCNMNLSVTNIQQHATVSVSSFVHSVIR